MPANASTSTSTLTRLARYAFDTAAQANPPGIVTAADVLNAFGTPALNPTLTTGALSLEANLGDLPGAPRDIMVVNPSTFRQTCVNFPAHAESPPIVMNCPAIALTLWAEEPYALMASRNAIAAAASKGRPVSGADVVRAAGAIHLARPPTFTAGQGGTVTFIATLRTNSGVTSGQLCVAMPRHRYGMPRVVRCQ
jgi:hypothetical protein